MKQLYSHTLSLCPVCKEKIQARIIEKDGKVFLEKFCPAHGFSETLICSDRFWYEQSRAYVKPGQIPKIHNQDTFKGCPESCGFCNQHQQHTCLPVIEINNLCDLDCPVCLKKESPHFEMSIADFEGVIHNLLVTEGKVDVINLSGGEPLLHPHLIEFIELATQNGITQISISTNGLALLADANLRAKIKNTGAIIALQFDGFDDAAIEKLRGEPLLKKKKELITLFEKEDIRYSLVATIAGNVNSREVPAITDFFFRSKALTLMFQPIAFTGSATGMDETRHRITIPDVVHEIEKSSFVKTGDFNPLPCSHYSCFALSYYIKVDENRYFSLREFLGAENYLNLISNKTLPGLDPEGYSLMKQQLYEFWSAADSGNLNENVLGRIKQILKEMSSCGFSSQKALTIGMDNIKAIFIHHFMDVHNFDFARLVRCCNPYPRAGDKLIPVCAENI